jgi:hypothetical protein
LGAANVPGELQGSVIGRWWLTSRFSRHRKGAATWKEKIGKEKIGPATLVLHYTGTPWCAADVKRRQEDRCRF